MNVLICFSILLNAKFCLDLEVELPRRKSEKQKHEWIYVVAVFGGILIAVVFICAIIVVNRKTKAFFLSTKLIHPTLVSSLLLCAKILVIVCYCDRASTF